MVFPVDFSTISSGHVITKTVEGNDNKTYEYGPGKKFDYDIYE